MAESAKTVIDPEDVVHQIELDAADQELVADSFEDIVVNSVRFQSLSPDGSNRPTLWHHATHSNNRASIIT